MRPSIFLKLLACCLFLLCLDRVHAVPPNIVYILCDDLGVGDLKAFNSESKIQTPHIDLLAIQGMRFTDAHSGSAVCTPTRYGILCGQYAWRTRLQEGVLGGLSPSLIASHQWTVPKLLKQRNYHSACIGKWHLGLDWKRIDGKSVPENSIESSSQHRNVDYDAPFEGGPLDHGFDEFFGISASLDMVPYTFLKDRQVTQAPSDEKSFGMRSSEDTNQTRLGPASPDFAAEDVLPRLTREAIEYLERRTQTSNAQPFFLYLPFASPHTPIAPTQDWAGKSGLNAYADFVMQQDHCVGEILKALKDLKLDQDTVVFFTSDNGCSDQADLPALKKQGHDPCRPYRGHKADIYEGGHRVPLIVKWPGKIAAGSIAKQTVCHVDLMATAADLAQLALPADAGLDSYSMKPILLNENATPMRTSTVHHSINGSFALRRGAYKLCFCGDSGGWSEPKPGSNLPNSGIQLFNLDQDIGETTNIAAEEPVLVHQMTREMEQIINRGRSTPGAASKNDVAVNLWKRSKRPRPLHEMILQTLPEMALRTPAWSSQVVTRESSVLLQLQPDGPIESRLAFEAAEIEEIRSADGSQKFELGRDCRLSDDRLKLIWNVPVKIEPITSGQMFPPKDSPNSYRHRASNPEQNMFYAPGNYFHLHNVEVTYRRPSLSLSPSPTSSPGLSQVREKLRSKMPVRIAVSGDSISTGLDASATTQTAPNQPGYPDLVAAQLTRDYEVEIALENRSISGWSIANGLADLDTLLEFNPDLLIVAYGMNDVGRRDPSWFSQQASAIDVRAREKLPNIEILWVAPMLGNSEWVHTPRDMFALYRDELKKMVGPKSDLADLTEVWTKLLEHKHDLDLTGNGLNHPNDFGHRLYAQCILERL